ncbi:MAG: roadblock/LC7 domain-containing protein [Deltaproteobacteria bacterium]|nr:roadblock/LC7 domain-containing protein [Deltaproteobacteria bacterium]
MVSRAERNKLIEQNLVALTSLRGVTTAAIVDSDGFVTHIRRDFEVDTDALGAAVQVVLSASKQASGHVAQRDVRLILSENEDGIIILAPLTRDFALAVVTDKSAMLGAVRFEIRETIPELNALFGG